MNILFLDQYSECGGAQLCLLDLLPAVREAGWKAHLAAPGEGPLFGKAQADTVNVIPCGPSRLELAVQLPRLKREISRLIERYAIDLLYVNGPRLLPAAARQRVPVLFHCHSRLRRGDAWLAGRALRTSAATVAAVCRFAAEPLAPHIDPTNLHIALLGQTIGFCRLPVRKTTKIGMVGRIHPHKGQREFIEAARLLNARHPDLQFPIFGAPLFGGRSDESLRTRAEGLPVTFHGWRADAGSIYPELDLLVVPSLKFEATPRVILEAFESGVPVVAFATGGIPEIIDDGKNGFLATPATPAALADTIAGLLESPDRMRRAAKAAAADWRKRFTLQAYRQRMVALIARAANRPAASGTETQTAAP